MYIVMIWYPDNKMEVFCKCDDEVTAAEKAEQTAKYCADYGGTVLTFKVKKDVKVEQFA